MSKFHEAATKIVEEINEHGDDTGNKAAAAIGMFLLHDLSVTNSQLEAVLRHMVDQRDREIERLQEENNYLRDLVNLGVSPNLYAQLGLGRNRGTA